MLFARPFIGPIKRALKSLFNSSPKAPSEPNSRQIRRQEACLAKKGR